MLMLVVNFNLWILRTNTCMCAIKQKSFTILAHLQLFYCATMVLIIMKGPTKVLFLLGKMANLVGLFWILSFVNQSSLLLLNSLLIIGYTIVRQYLLPQEQI